MPTCDEPCEKPYSEMDVHERLALLVKRVEALESEVRRLKSDLGEGDEPEVPDELEDEDAAEDEPPAYVPRYSSGSQP